MRAERRGMTLVELIAAIAIAGLVLLGALLLLDSVSDSVRRIENDAAAVTADGTTFGLLHQLLNDATATFDTTKRFEGDDHGFTCWTRCREPQGWTAACRVDIAIVDSGPGSVFRASFANSNERTLQRYGRTARLRYFDADRQVWRSAWSGSATIPVALEVVAGNDTTIYSIGPARD
jgi:prepilin-type N-terminal cleavage/methylation domain-containing protein